VKHVYKYYDFFPGIEHKAHLSINPGKNRFSDRYTARYLIAEKEEVFIEEDVQDVVMCFVQTITLLHCFQNCFVLHKTFINPSKLLFL
jgi:hypothetical protein